MGAEEPMDLGSDDLRTCATIMNHCGCGCGDMRHLQYGRAPNMQGHTSPPPPPPPSRGSPVPVTHVLRSLLPRSIGSSMPSSSRTVQVHKPYKCKCCSECFSETSSLKSHVRVHLGEKRYMCEHCGKSCGCTGDLQTHLRIYSRKKSYKCEHCGKSFKRNIGLKIFKVCTCHYQCIIRRF